MPSSAPGLVSLSLPESQLIADGVIEAAEEQGIKVTVSICDLGGRILLMNRMDGAPWGSIQGSQGKAIASACFNISTGRLAPEGDATDVGQTHQHVRRMDGQQMIFTRGGVAVFHNNVAVAGCGVAGGTGEQDEKCARAGIAKFQASQS